MMGSALLHARSWVHFLVFAMVKIATVTVNSSYKRDTGEAFAATRPTDAA